jgi:hypothetical protein
MAGLFQLGLFGVGLEEHRRVWFAYFGDFRECGVDCDGLLMQLSDYGKDTLHGWQIDHTNALALGGSDHPSNKRPRNSYGNARAGAMLGNALRSAPKGGLF